MDQSSCAQPLKRSRNNQMESEEWFLCCTEADGVALQIRVMPVETVDGILKTWVKGERC